MFVGAWKGEKADDNIYKDWQTGEHGSITQAAPTSVDALNCMIDRKRYTVMKHKVIKLTGLDDDDGGMSTRHVKLWIPVNKIITFKGADTGNKDIIPNIELRMLPAVADTANFTGTGNIFRYDLKAVGFFKDN